MAFTPATLNLMLTAVGGGPQIWHYTNTDAHTDVDATDYFAKMGFGTLSDKTTRGMRVNDIVFYIDTDTATLTVHYVSAIDSEGNATVAAATLA